MALLDAARESSRTGRAIDLVRESPDLRWS
jgi:hypothetical protein